MSINNNKVAKHIETSALWREAPEWMQNQGNTHTKYIPVDPVAQKCTATMVYNGDIKQICV
jgi:hypothetical protein